MGTRLRPAKICIDCRYLRERPSGVATIVQALVDYVPALAPELSFLLLRHPNASAPLSRAPNVTERVVAREANGPATMFAMPWLAELHDVDLFHNPFQILPHGLRMRTVVTILDLMWVLHPSWARSPGWWGYVESTFYGHGICHALRHATRLIAISDATRADIAKVDPAAAARTLVVHEGVAAWFRPAITPEELAHVARVRERYLPGARRHLLAVGQSSPYKNHEMVLRAFARAFHDEPEVQLGLVERLGQGERSLRPIAAALGVAERVRLLRDVPFDDLVALYQGALCLCHPSLMEGFGNGPAEAMACGCPVVTSNRSSMPEVSAGAALLVDPESIASIAAALGRVARDHAEANRMRERGLVRASELSWKRCAEQTLALYREVLDA